MNTNIRDLHEKSKKLTKSPGVYLMKDKHYDIIYIGKAKNLKNRVSSYFTNINRHDPKVLKMLDHICDFDFIVTSSEFEALVLECSLIKQYSPKYNILLKDDKGYHYIKITNEDYPKITAQKSKNDESSYYIGPYMSGFTVSKTVDEVNKIFMLPTCNRQFPRDFNKERPCLNYYIHQCSAPCRGIISKDEYNKSIKDAVDYIKKGSSFSIEKLKSSMIEASENMEFEKAAKLRDKIFAINRIYEKQNVIIDDTKSIDVIGCLKNNNFLIINMLIFRNGRLIDKDDILISDISNVEESLREFVTRYYSNKSDIPEIVLSTNTFNDFKLITQYLSNLSNKPVKIIVPDKGHYKKLVDMAYNNALEQLSFNGYNKSVNILSELADILNMDSLPKYIEAYDVSNFGSETIVAAMVVFENAMPKKKYYKRFSIKGIDIQDDYSSIKQAITRRFDRYFSSDNKDVGFATKPDLILLDGGKGHVGSVKPIIEKYDLDIPIYGLVKDNKHKTRAIATDGSEISIKSNKNVFTFLTKIQDEVHRYCISYSRKKHSSKGLEMNLMNISGVGEKRAAKIIRHFKTKECIINAELEEISKVAGVSLIKAGEIKKFLKS